MTEAAYLSMQGLSKAYPGVVALRAANLEVRRGEAVALMGANGAGKSTLMNVLGGVAAPDAGSITIDGSAVRLRTARDALAHGIAFVHQELAMLPSMTVAENVFADGFPTRFGIVDGATMRRDAAELLARLGCNLPTDLAVETLGPGDRQMVEIARALRRAPRIMIFDEPTSSLTNNEKRRLFEIVQGLKRDGVAIIYITHFVDEIFEICDRVTVMRSGSTVAIARYRRDESDRDRPADAGRSRQRRTSRRRGRNRRSRAAGGEWPLPAGFCATSTSVCARARSWACGAFSARGEPS